jgi:eukaryotic-like serine/threonine-protein kinase
MTEPARPLAIGRYQILDMVGSGAMGTVYKAHDPAIGRDVAIKVVRIDADSMQQRAASIDRFRLEVQAAGRCSHPAIVGVYDFLDQAGDPAIVMELVEGTSLHRRMRDLPGGAASLLPGILPQVLEGLGYAHGQGIIHRDIKPANILVTTAGQAKIADFGVARLSDANATLGGAMMGTPSYMAPEQLTDDAVDRRADLFSVGSILYEMLAGRPPFAGRTVGETVLRLSSADTADMGPVVAAGGQRFVPTLQRALAKDRTRRFQTADAFAAMFQGALSDRRGAVEDEAATIVIGSRRARTAMFDPSLLQHIESHLARFVGPMARRMVSRAAQEVGSTSELYASLARELPDAAGRSLFLRLVGGGRVEPSLGGRGRPAQALAPQSTGPASADPRTSARQALLPYATTDGAIPPVAAAAAQAILVQYVGPIARVLVRDAAAQAITGRDFIDRLCVHVTRPDERTAVQRRLRAEIEPKLP